MTLDEIRRNVDIRLNKDTTGLSLTTEDFNSVLELVNLEYFKLNFGLPEQYEKMATFAGRQWEVSQKITDDFNPFLVSLDGRNKSFLKVDSEGFAVLPEDYFHVSAIGFDYMVDEITERKVVEIMTNAQWESRLGSFILMPNLKWPVCRFLKGVLEFSPRNVGVVAFNYLRKPVVPFFAVVEDQALENEVYDPDNSVQLEWPDDVHTDIVNMIVSYASDNLKDQFVKQSAETRKIQGV